MKNSVKGGPQKLSTAVSMQDSVWNGFHYFLSLDVRMLLFLKKSEMHFQPIELSDLN